MTVVENLVRLKAERNATWAEIEKITGVNAATMAIAAKGRRALGSQAISKLVAFDQSFSQYVEYKYCTVCGKRFIPLRDSHATCSQECQNINRNIENKRYMREYWERMRMAKPKETKKFESLKEYNEKAREKYGDYGQRSAAERLAQSMTMRESMGLE